MPFIGREMPVTLDSHGDGPVVELQGFGRLTPAHSERELWPYREAACASARCTASSARRASSSSARSTAKLGVPGGFIDFDSADGAKLLGPVVDGLTDVLMKGYSHEDEYAADQVAIDLLVSAGYNPHEYIHFLSRIPDQRGLMTSHPDKDDRHKKARAYLMALATKGPFGGADYSKYADVKLKDELKVVRK